MQIRVKDTDGNPLAGISIRFSVGTMSSEEAIYDNKTNSDGAQSWPIPFWPETGYTLHINTGDEAQTSYSNTSVYVRQPLNGQYEDVDVVLSRQAALVTIKPITGVNKDLHRFTDSDGKPVRMRGASSFLLYKKFLDGQDITPQLTQFNQLGANMIRVFGMFESLGGFDPKQYPQYYDRLVEFSDLVASYGIYILWALCAATQSIFSNDNQVLDHIKKMVDKLKQSQNAIVSPVNEQGQHNNSINLSRVAAEVDFGWLQHDMGSYGEDEACVAPFGTYCALHTKRRWPSSVKDGCSLDHPNYPAYEILMEEPDRYGDNGNTSIQQARDAGGTSYASLGWVAHTLQGERAEVLTGNSLDCVRASLEAMNAN